MMIPLYTPTDPSCPTCQGDGWVWADGAASRMTDCPEPSCYVWEPDPDQAWDERFDR